MAKKKQKSKKRASKKRVSRRKLIRRKSVSKTRRKKGRVTRAKKKGKPRSKPAKTPELPSEPIGKVTHYFSKARAAALMIEREGIRAGDVLYFKGHTTNFKQKVESLEINRQPVSQAGPGEEVGIRVRSRTREHDRVFKL